MDCTVEFFEAVRAHMSPESLLMMNLFDISPGRELLVRTLVTLKRVFPTVMALSVGHGNRMLLAFSKDTSEDAIRERLRNVRETEAIERLAEQASTHIVDYNIPPNTAAFTVDFAPVEEITRRMLKSD